MRLITPLLMGVLTTLGALLLGQSLLVALAFGLVPFGLGAVAVRTELAYLFGTSVLILGVLNLALPVDDMFRAIGDAIARLGRSV